MLLEPRELEPRLAHRRGAGGAARGHAGAHRRRDARLGARARHPAARRPSPARPRELDELRRGLGGRARAARHPRRGARARIRSRSGRTSRSPPARATSSLYASMRELARREPTFALHVHVAVPDPEQAVRALTTACARTCRCCSRCRRNSPFWQGRDTGLASTRTPLFQAFPRVGIPRVFALLRRLRRGHRRAAALRRVPRADLPVVGRAAAAALRHARGARDGRADAASPTPPRSTALVQCLVRLEAHEGHASHDARVATRGARGEPLPRRARRHGRRASSTRRASAGRPAREWLGELLDACAPHAAELRLLGRARDRARARRDARRRAPALARRPRPDAAARPR